MNRSGGITESRFYMWRAVVAMIHADNIVTSQELCFINSYIHDLNLSEEQFKVILNDVQTPKSAQNVFQKITAPEDKKDFFALARAISWSDGDFVEQEKIIIQTLEKHCLCDDNLQYLHDSKEIVNEIELHKNQWNFLTNRSKNLFGFLTERKHKTT